VRATKRWGLGVIGGVVRIARDRGTSCHAKFSFL
jgi:hypothetical protein